MLDFEYGGWDHPLRVLSNFFSHEQMRTLSTEQRTYLLDQYLLKTTLPKEVTSDWEAFLLLSRVEWLAVNLVSVLPDKLARFLFSKGPDFDIQDFLTGRLRLIRERLAELAL